MGQLDGKVAIVTGAGSGIGRAIALGFAREGVSVAVSDIDSGRAEAVAGEIGERAISIACDVRDTSQVDTMAEQAAKQFGRLDILVNNAGKAARGLVANLGDDDWDAAFATNVRGTFTALAPRSAI